MSSDGMSDEMIALQQKTRENAIKLESMETQLRKSLEETKQYKTKYDNCAEEVC